MKSTLTVVGGPQDGQVLEIDAGAVCTLGSAPSASLHAPLANVAPQHATVELDPAQGLVIADLGSEQGTYVNGEKVSASHPLADGDRVCLGPPGAKQSLKLVVRLSSGDAAPEEEPAILLDPGADEGAPLILDDTGSEPALTVAEPEMAEPEPEMAVPEPEMAEPEPEMVEPEPALPPEPPPPPPRAAPARPQTQAAAAPPTPAQTPPPEARKPAKPDYADDVPSIVPTSRESEPLPIAPPLPEKLKLKGKPSTKAAPPPSRLALAVGAGLLLSGGLFFGWRWFVQQEPPVLTSILPPRVEAGQTVTLAGTGLGSDPVALTVRFGSESGKVISASGTQAAVMLPDLAPTSSAQEIQVSAESRGVKSNALFVTVVAPPRIAALAPDVAQPGDEVTASGKNLGGKPLTVTVGGQNAEVLEAQPQSLRFRVPALPLGRPAPVVVQVGKEAGKAATLFLGRLPLLLEAGPLRAMAGERVTLKGRGFEAGSRVTFDGEPVLVFSATDTEMVVAAPSARTAASQAETSVVVESRGSRSSPATVILTRSSSGYFAPRYFPAPMPDQAGFALVSTDLGPLLAVGGKGDAPSTAERAGRIAAALNALVEQATSKPVTVEVRDKPALGIAAAGSPSLLATVAAEDLQAYAAVDATLRSRQVTLRNLAAFWAALVQDQISLFVRHERPMRVVELSPRGRALTQIHAEAVRRAGPGGGVPMGLVSPLSSSLARDLREMALVLPGEGQSLAAAAVQGRWEGTMWEEGRDKPITVRLRVSGKSLSGTLTTRVGGIAVDLPLQDAAYEKGTLRFTVVMGGAARRFEGAVKAEQVEGGIQRAAGGAALGRFSLKYAE